MKKIVTFFSSLVIALVCLLFLSSWSNQTNPIDRIDEYFITIEANNDGTLEMNYHIKWTVLDDEKEGPLDWVKIGVPNKFVSNIKSNSTSVKDAFYYSNNAAYIRCNLDRSYYKNESVDIDFSFTQSHMYTFNQDNTKVEYDFTPGWFDNINVSSIVVKVKKGLINEAFISNITTEDSDYYIWTSSLKSGESIKCSFFGLKSSFPTIIETDTYTDEYQESDDIIPMIAIAVIFIVIVAIIVIVSRINDESYYSYRGFYGHHIPSYYYMRIFHHGGYNNKGEKFMPKATITNSTRSGGGGHSCACACACACAGGGRAGCSRKDFYNPKFKTKDLETK